MLARAAVTDLVGVTVILNVSGCFLGAASRIEHANVAFDISPDGENIVFSSANGELCLLHLKTLQVRQLSKPEVKASTPTFSPDGKSIAYSAEVEGHKGKSLFVCSVNGDKMQQLTDRPDVTDFKPSYSPDGSQIVFARAHRYRPYSMGGWTWDDWDVCVIKSDGTQLRRITEKKQYGVRSPHFFRNAKSVLYSAEAARGQGGDLTSILFEVDANGGEPPKPLTKKLAVVARHGAWASEPGMSRDGNQIVFVSDRIVPYHYDVFIMDQDGQDPKPLGVTTISRYNQNPVFMPDGKSVLFLAGTERNAGARPIFSLWQVEADGKKPRRISDSGLFTDPVNWKPKP